ncbi:MAG TPA: GAF and ANTAR domain-containing protein [Arthrobacter sp.]|nr:GAF and ANTAR domain-containing protein [Arthrobacter sp.]
MRAQSKGFVRKHPVKTGLRLQNASSGAHQAVAHHAQPLPAHTARDHNRIEATMASGPDSTSTSTSTSTVDRLQDLLLQSKDFEAFLLDLTRYSAARIGNPPPMMCTIAVQRGSAPVTAASSGAGARQLDERHYGLDDGPCLTALAEGRTVLVQDLAAESRWPLYFDAVRNSGVRAVLAVPIDAGAAALAALNCYARQPAAFGPATVAGVELYAQSISRPLRLAFLVHPSLELASYPDGLRAPLRSRATMDAALALVMAHTRSSREAAVSLLVEASTASKAKLPALALDIVRGAAIPAASS